MGAAGKPACEFCGKGETVLQATIYGKLYYVHPWCRYGMTKLIERRESAPAPNIAVTVTRRTE